MERYHDVLVSTAGPDRKVYTVFGLELAQWFIPNVQLTGLDTRERHFRRFLRYHRHVWRGDLGGLG